MRNTVQKAKYYLSKQHYKENKKCPNCGNVYSENYCNRCGQSVHEVNKPFKEFLVDFLGSLYAFDLRFWYSVKVLFTKPEKLSEEYLKGKRANYTPPFKLYFFVSFIFFFVVNWKTESGMDGKDVFLSSDSSMVTMSTVNDSIKSGMEEKGKNASFSFHLDSILSIQKEETDSFPSNEKKGWFNLSEQKVKDILQEEGARKLFLSKALSYSSWMLFLLMPVYALLLMLLHYRRKSYFVSHLVFAINSHTLFFLIVTLLLLIQFEAQWIFLSLWVYYMLRSMKKFYNQSWGKAILKFFILTTLYNFVLLAAFVMVFIISLGTY